MNRRLLRHGVILLAASISVIACGEPDQTNPPTLILDMGLDMNQPQDMPAPEFDFVYTLPDIPIVDECDPENEDLPDRFAIDSNCDGIDGDESRSIFVASYGDDLNDGSRYMPLLTLQKAIDMVEADPNKDWVLAQEGRYQEVLELADGVSVAGGYELGWRRDGNGFSQVIGGNPTVRGANIISTTYIMNLEVRPTEQLASDRSSVVSMALEQSPGVILERMFILGGTGRRGVDGGKGENGTQGANGGNGGRGREDSSGVLCSSNSRPTPGRGGSSSCGAGDGSAGGSPGKETGSGSDGTTGLSSGDAAGGSGGSGASKSRNGGEGLDGDVGATGGSGAGASGGGSFLGYEWQGLAGGSGEAGIPGSGAGGGGGGGGGEDGCDSYGGAGGGGGSGGCAGAGGPGGGPGGASVALMLTDSDIIIRACRIVMGQGGAGGDGGSGGFGGEGGDGGDGGNREDDSGRGGPGGVGGKGGTGGPGGGGSGGPSYGVYSNIPLTVEPAETNYVEGAAGFGGSGAGGAGQGAAGVMVPIQTQSRLTP